MNFLAKLLIYHYSSYLMKDKELESQIDKNAVRVTFSFQDDDVSRMDDLRHRLGHDIAFVNKSEIVRLGLLALEGLSAQRVAELADNLRRVRAGRRTRDE